MSLMDEVGGIGKPMSELQRIAKFIIEECGVDVNANLDECGGDNATALYKACESGNLELVKYLVEECGSDVKITGEDTYGNTPLGNAIESGNTDLVKYLFGRRMQCKL